MESLISALFSDIPKLLEQNSFKKLNEVIKQYSFYSLFKPTDIDSNINSNIQDSDFIIINYYKAKMNLEGVFILSFNKTIIIIDQSLISNLQPFFSSNSNRAIYFLNDSKSIFNNDLTIKNIQFEADEIFQEEIANFSDQLKINKYSNHSINKIWYFISNCIAGYLIKKSYSKLNHQIAFKDSWNENQFIILRLLGVGSSFNVHLVYCIENENLFAIKKPLRNDLTSLKLINREI